MADSTKYLHEYGINWIWFYPTNDEPSFRLHKGDAVIPQMLAESTERTVSSKTDNGADLWKARVRFLNMRCEQLQLQLDELIADVKKLKTRKPRKQKEDTS